MGGRSEKYALQSIKDNISIHREYAYACPFADAVKERDRWLIKYYSFREDSNVAFAIKEILQNMFGNLENGVSIWGSGYWGRFLIEKLKKCNIKVNVIVDENFKKKDISIYNNVINNNH